MQPLEDDASREHGQPAGRPSRPPLRLVRSEQPEQAPPGIFTAPPGGTGPRKWWPTALLMVLSNLVTIILIRHHGMIWPAYFFGVLTFVNLFAIALRGMAVIRRTAIATVLATVFWWVSPAAKEFLPLSGAPGWSLGPAVIWVLLVAYSACLLRGSIPDNADESQVIRTHKTMFLVIAAFVFGMWGVIDIRSEYGTGSRWLPGLVVIAVVVMPLVLMSADAVARAADAGHRGRAVTGAALTAASTYVTALQLLIVVAGHVWHAFPWPFNAVSALGVAHLPWGLIGGWKQVISCVVVTIGFAAIAESTVREILAESTNGRPAGREPKTTKQFQAHGQRRTGIPNPAQQVSERVYTLSLQVSKAIEIAAGLGTQMFVRIAFRVCGAFLKAPANIARAVWVLAVTGVLFSGASRLMIAACHDLARYAGSSGVGYGGLSLWGGLVFLSGMLLILGCCAFALLSRVARRAEDAGSPLTEDLITSACITAAITAALGTLGTGLMWVLDIVLPHVGIRVRALELGPLLRLNVYYLAGVMLLLLIAAWRDGRLKADDAHDPDQDSSSIYRWHAGILITTVVLAAILGWDPIIHWVASVW